MTIIQALIRLRDDLKTWVSNNLRTKLNKNLGTLHSNKLLVVNEEGEIVAKSDDFINERIVEAVEELDATAIGITYGTTDLGTSATLPTGHFYFVLAD